MTDILYNGKTGSGKAYAGKEADKEAAEKKKLADLKKE